MLITEDHSVISFCQKSLQPWKLHSDQAVLHEFMQYLGTGEWGRCFVKYGKLSTLIMQS